MGDSLRTERQIPLSPRKIFIQISQHMDSRKLSLLLSSLISQLILLLLHIFPSETPLFLNPDSNPNSNAFLLVHHLLSSQQIAVSLSLLSISRKRKRIHLLESESEVIDEEKYGNFKLWVSQNPDSFKVCFKMSSSTFEWLSGLLEPLLDCRDPVSSPLDFPVELRLGIGLFRLATGSDYPGIARRFGVPESAARFCTKQLCRVLCTNYRFWVGFPTMSEIDSVSAAFEDVTGLPNCCGVIGCTRFKVLNKERCQLQEDEKKIEESIVAQLVVDSSLRILSIVAGFRGDKEDLMVLKSSTLYKDAEEGKLLNSPPIDLDGVEINQYLVGDGKYPLLPWLMVPFVDAPPGSCEEHFNAAHSFIRLSALRTIGCLKNWGVLGAPIEEELKTAIACIGACSILHNVLLMRQDISAFSDSIGEYNSADQRSQSCRNTCLEGDSSLSNVLATRNALARRAKSKNKLLQPN